MAVIDADAHVVEWERTWEYMDESEMAFRPRVMVFKDAAQKPSGQRVGEYWMIGGRVFAKDSNIGFDIPKEKREAADIEARLAHMVLELLATDRVAADRLRLPAAAG